MQKHNQSWKWSTEMRKPQNITTKEKWDQSDEFSKNSWEWLSISSETLVEKEKNSSVFSAANFSVPRFVWPLWPAVTSGGEVPVSDVNKVWNALKCYNLHPDPCWLATRECRNGRWSEVSFGGQTLLMPHHVGWTIYIIESCFVPSSPPPPSLPAPDRCHLLTHSHF